VGNVNRVRPLMVQGSGKNGKEEDAVGEKSRGGDQKGGGSFEGYGRKWWVLRTGRKLSKRATTKDTSALGGGKGNSDIGEGKKTSKATQTPFFKISRPKKTRKK